MKTASRICVACLALAHVPLSAQDPPSNDDRLARVVAVVGDSAITDIDLQEQLAAWRAQARRDPPPPGPELDALLRELLDGRVTELLLLQAATRDTTLAILDSEVAGAVDNHIARLRQQFGGQAGLDRALAEQGQTLTSFRDGLMVQARRDQTIDRYLAGIRQDRKPPPVTEAEVRAFWDGAKDEVDVRPAMISFEQVVIPVSASDTALATSRALADSVHQRLVAKEDFATLARRYSEDPGSREVGGDLGWFRQGVMFRQFDLVAFSPYMRAGDLSPPVRTPFGYHIIRVDRVRGAERQVRHILIRPKRSAEDVEHSREEAEQIAERIRGGESVTELAQQLGDPDEERRVGPWPQDSLPPPYRDVLAGATVGQVVGPLELEGAADLRKWAVLKVTAVEASRPATLDDYRDQIRDSIARQKLIDEIIQDIRRATLVEIRLAGPSPDD